MKLTLLSALLIWGSLSSYAQQSAITEFGEEVILYEDGTWVF